MGVTATSAKASGSPRHSVIAADNKRLGEDENGVAIRYKSVFKKTNDFLSGIRDNLQEMEKTWK